MTAILLIANSSLNTRLPGLSAAFFLAHLRNSEVGLIVLCSGALMIVSAAKKMSSQNSLSPEEAVTEGLAGKVAMVTGGYSAMGPERAEEAIPKLAE